jgi:hypothetical protein
MPIRQMLKDHHAFGPDEVAKLTAAFEDALQKMGSVGRDDPVALTLAGHIIELARQGETDPAPLVRRCPAETDKTLNLAPETDESRRG